MDVTLYEVPADTTSPIALGQTLAVPFATPGQNGRLTFQGVAGQAVSVDATNSTYAGGRLALLRGANPPADAVPLATAPIDGFVNSFALPADGEYSILVDPEGASTGSVDITLLPDAVGRITPGGPMVPISNRAAGQNMRLSFRGSAGQRISLSLATGIGGCCSGTNVSIVHPNGQLVLARSAVGRYGHYFDVITLPDTGAYTIRIDPDGTTIGEVRSTLYAVPDDATGILTPGQNARVPISTPGQNARYTFEGTKDKKISLTMGTGMGGCCGGVDLRIKRPNNGGVLASADFGRNGGFIDATLLPDTGTYIVEMNPHGAATGAIDLALYEVTDEVTGVLTPGQTVRIALSPPGRNARYTFEGAKDQKISLKMDTPMGQPGSGVELRILRPNNGGVLATRSFGYFGSFIDTTPLPDTGTYIVEVNPQGANVGNVDLTLHSVPDDVTGVLTPGAAKTTAIAPPGRNARFTFDGAVDQRISLKMDTNMGQPGSGVSLRIRNPTSSTVLYSRNFGHFDAFMDTVTLTEGGTYIVEVDPEGANVGDITLTLYNVPADLAGEISIGGAAMAMALDPPGRNARQTFYNSAAGAQVTLHLTEVTMGNCCGGTKVSIVSPGTSTVVASRSVGHFGGTLVAQLPTEGTYAVLIDPEGALVGSLKVRLSSP